MDEPRFYEMDIYDANLEDLRREIIALEKHRGRLQAIVDDDQGGIIAYAIGEDNARGIVNALNEEKPWKREEKPSAD
jgi:hypothetical protein